MPTAGELVIECLAAHGIDRVFCVPGESYLGLLDPLHGRADMDTVVCRHESGAGFMALADARLTGRPGVALVSRGPGASNAAIAVHTAQQDGVPFLLLIGHVAKRDVRRDSFQEIDYHRMVGGMAKWVSVVTNPDRMAETMLRALQTATTGLPGPVVVAVPEDVLTAEAAGPVPQPQAPVRAAPHPDDLATLRTWLTEAERPLLLAGSGLERRGGRDALLRAAENWVLPTLVSFRRQDLFPNAHPLYAGDMGLSNPATQMALLHEADLLLVAGARLGDITTQNYSFPSPGLRLVHVHADPGVIGVQFPAALAFACDPAALLDGLGQPPAPPQRGAWAARLSAERRRIAAPRNRDVSDGVPFEAVVQALKPLLPPDAIVTLDAGTFAAPIYRSVDFRPPQRLLAPIAGAMGFGVPAAVAAALREPGRTVVCLVGDGGFGMTGSELAVAKQRRLPLKVIVSENGIYGSIRIHQEREYPGRVSGTSFSNPDFALMGEAYGFPITRIGTAADLDRLPGLIRSPGPEFIVVATSVAAILP